MSFAGNVIGVFTCIAIVVGTAIAFVVGTGIASVVGNVVAIVLDSVVGDNAMLFWLPPPLLFLLSLSFFSYTIIPPTATLFC